MATNQNANSTEHGGAAGGKPLLSVRDLATYFRVEGGIAKAVDGVSFDVMPGEVLGIVGESGSGKSVTSLSILRLIPDPPGMIERGEMLYEGQDLLKLSYKEMRAIRGNEIAMIFQEPMTSLNPVFTIGMQIIETLSTHNPEMTKQEAFDRAVLRLSQVKIPDAEKRMKDYPHQFSGGMRQRVMIAMALCCNPKLLIADEPTTALDVTTQAQILNLMLELRERREGGSIILITHDLAVVAETCQRVIVMYGGKIQEVGNVDQIFYEPRHPYTQGLLESLPSTQEAKKRLHTIPGNVPFIMDLPTGCKFCTRCDQVMDRCHNEEPPLHQLKSGQLVRCHLAEEDSTGFADAPAMTNVTPP